LNRRSLLSLAALIPLFSMRNAAAAVSPADVEGYRKDWKALLNPKAQVAANATPVTMTDAEWQKQLAPKAYDVLRHEGTEYPGTSPLNEEHRAGVFVCQGCALPLFTSKMKFDSGTGWPSFFTTIPGAFAMSTDYKMIVARNEYHCAKCGGHHGHLFEDGPAPTRQRWCSNGVALRFIPLA
jgi:peptide-methionine (R)-S-oxide reductase